MRMLFREFAAATLRRQDDENGRITQAWQVVRIYAKSMRDKRVPKLSSLLIGPQTKKERRQSPEQMHQALQMIHNQSKGLKPRPRG